MQIRKPLFDTCGHTGPRFKNIVLGRRFIFRIVYASHRTWLEFRWRQTRGGTRYETLLFAVVWGRRHAKT